MVEMRKKSTFLFFTPEVETDQMKVQIGRKTRFLGFYGLKNRILKFRPLPAAASAGPDLGDFADLGHSGDHRGAKKWMKIVKT